MRKGILFICFVLFYTFHGYSQTVLLDTTKGVLPEVIITAEKRPENFKKVPITLNVLSPSTLKELSINSLSDLTLHVPNLNILSSRSSPNTAAVFIRGIGQEDNVFTVDAGVGIYLDDILIPRAQGALLDIYDIDRIEILKGPQGALYGRNTIAGAIKYFSKKPSREYLGKTEITVGNYKRRELKSAINIPLIKDKLLSRISFGTFLRDGFEKNTFNGEKTDAKNTSAGRANILWIPSPKVNIELKFDGSIGRDGIRVGSLLRSQNSALNYTDLLRARIVTFPKEEPFKIRANTQNKFDIDTWGFGSDFNIKLTKSANLKMLTSYRKLKENSRFDFDATEARAADVFIQHNHKQFTNEIQLNYESKGITLTSGLFYFYEFDDQFDGTDASAKGFSQNAFYSQKVNSYAAYANFKYKIKNSFSFNLGIRYTTETKVFSRKAERHFNDTAKLNFNVFGGFGVGSGGIPPLTYPGNGTVLADLKDLKNDWGAVTPRFTFQYEPNDKSNFFLSVSRGFKSGGYNGRASGVSANPLQKEPYAPEYVWSYELGHKGYYFNRSLDLNLSFFYNDYTDIQLASFGTIIVSGAPTFVSLFTNAARASTKGFDMDFIWKPSYLKIFGGLGLTKSKYTKYIERDVDVSSRKFPNAPELTGTLGLSYSIDLTKNHATSKKLYLIIGANAAYQDKRFLTVSNLPDLLQKEYFIFNCFSAIESANNKWGFSLHLNNLADKKYMSAGLDASSPPFGIVNAFYGPPRTIYCIIYTRF